MPVPRKRLRSYSGSFGVCGNSVVAQFGRARRGKTNPVQQARIATELMQTFGWYDFLKNELIYAVSSI